MGRRDIDGPWGVDLNVVSEHFIPQPRAPNDQRAQPYRIDGPPGQATDSPDASRR